MCVIRYVASILLNQTREYLKNAKAETTDDSPINKAYSMLLEDLKRKFNYLNNKLRKI